MSKVPKVTLNKSKVYKATLNYTGDMCNMYSPLYNLVDKDSNKLKDFTTPQLNFDLKHPVDILVQDSYDGSVNLILNDDKNAPKLINSRFSIQEDNKFRIPDHRGYKDTNTYHENTFIIDTALKPIPLKIPKIKYDGLYENQGNLKCGVYTFYFKLSDVDGNESEVVAESGIVPIHIGTPNNPQEIRMGLENENSKKSIQFTLTNLDSGFDYIHVLYARSSSGNDLATVESYYKVEFDYPIDNNQCVVHITGNEHTSTVEQKDLYVDYADIQSVKTQTECANVLMFGNINKPYHDYDDLQRMSWKIIPKPVSLESNSVGHINTEYKNSDSDSYNDSILCYYNTKNVYYRLGYWPDEIYRFGIVYIFNDNSLSPVFNIQGIDFSKVDYTTIKDNSSEESFYEKAFFQNGDSQWECDPEDSFFNKELEGRDISAWKLNSKGVIKFAKTPTINSSNDGILQPKPLGIEFDFKYINNTHYNRSKEDLFKKHNIKGFFFVRQRRIPTILGQGIAIGVTEKAYGNIPVVKGQRGQFITESFLGDDRLIYQYGNIIDIPNSNVKVRGLLLPDAEVCEGVYNDIFVGNDYCLDRVGKYSFSINNDYHISYNKFQEKSSTKYIASLLNIPEDISILSNGEDYFSTIAGSPSEPFKTIDVKYEWDKTVPQTLTESTSLVRGKFGAFVGVGSPTHDGNFPFQYGEVYNIKEKRYAEDEDAASLLDFQRRFNDFSEYKPISDRTEVTTGKINCFRGDCFQSMFTHRMHRNFIDPELPTNNKIIDPSCWAANYAVRCTAAILTEAHSNLTDDSDGWVIPAPSNQPWIQALIYFLTGNIFGAIKQLVDGYKEPDITPEKVGLGAEYEWDATDGCYYKIKYKLDENGNIKVDKDGKPEKEGKGDKFDPNNLESLYPNGYANEIVQAFEVYIGDHEKGEFIKASKKKKKVNPQEQESAGGINFKAIFKADDQWDLRGLANINRADVNAVGLGHWITFPILASRNLAFRDIDYSNSTEQASFNRKRSFYPLAAMSKNNPIRDSNVINAATSISIPHKPYFGIMDYRFLKQEYFTRVYNSLTDSANSFTNEYKQILEISFQDYTKKCGSITKMITVNNIVYVIFEHGIGQVTFQPTHPGVSPEMMQDVILLQDSYGSIWKDSIIEAAGVIYGVDSVAKKIWCIANKQFKIISDFKVQKFLIDNLDMSEYTTKPYLGHVNIKTHYNAYKNDVIFTYYNDTPIKDEYTGEILEWKTGKTWSLCYNMILDTFTTFYDWYPVESVNIDNIYFSFDQERFNQLTSVDFKPEKNIPSPEQLMLTDGVTSYTVKKHKIDPMFNHNVTVLEVPKSQSIKVIPGKNNRVVSFYYKGYIKVSYREINPINSQEGEYNSLNNNGDFEWKHMLFILPKGLHKDSSYLELSNTKGGITEIVEIAYYPTSLYKEIQQYDKNLSGSGISSLILYDQENISKILKYNIRNTQNQMYLWKHGQAGVYDIQGTIKPTTWYNKQHEFSFEFIVNEQSSIQKIFNNLKIISNKTEPYKFEYEVVGEGYEWYELKPVIKWIHDKVNKELPNNITENLLDYWYKEVLNNTYGDLQVLYPDFPYLYGKQDDYTIPKLPYIDVIKDYTLVPPTTTQDFEHPHNSSKTGLVYDARQDDYNVRTTQIGNDIKKVGRAKGNMQYLEDLWDVEIRPVAFKYAYLDDDGWLAFTEQRETRHRDKYLKVKVCYSGEDLAVIQAIQTTFDFSYA